MTDNTYGSDELKNSLPEYNEEPLHVVFSWDAAGLPGLDQNFGLWVNDRLVVSDFSSTIGYSPSLSMSLLLGKGVSTFMSKDYKTSMACAYFKNLKVYNFAVGDGQTTFKQKIVPELYIDLSKDGLTWENPLTGGLPLIYDNIANEDYAKVYIRSRMPHKDVKKMWDSKTAFINAEWVIK